jgi:nicotinamidase/pyrazinamidase
MTQEEKSSMKDRALIVVDLQHDFTPGGALPVSEGDRIVPLADALAPRFETVVATQDWHPADHGSFAANHARRRAGEVIELNGLTQVLWPTHCVQGTRGAEFVPGEWTGRVTKVFRKGTDPAIDSYSGFYDNGHRRSTGLGEWLSERGIRDVYVMGLATDYCVKFTALDARRLGLNVHLIEDACRGVNLKPTDVADAVEEMKSAGVVVTASNAIRV